MRAATFVVLCALLGCVAARGVSRSCLPAFVWKPERPWVASGTRRLRPTAPVGGRAAACSCSRPPPSTAPPVHSSPLPTGPPPLEGLEEPLP